MDDAKDKASKIAKEAGEKFDELSDDAKETYQKAKAKATDFINEDAKEMLDDAKEKASKFADEAGDKLEDLAEDAKEVIEETTKKTKSFFQRLFGK